MISPDAPKGHVAVLADHRASGVGQPAAREAISGSPFVRSVRFMRSVRSGRALQNDHAGAFVTFNTTARRVPIDSAAVSSALAPRCVRESAGRLAAPARG
jgi:hypothetical protein